jgi:hypothetical protein
MPDPSAVVAEPLLLGSAVTRNARSEKKVLLVALTIGLFSALLWSQVPDVQSGAEDAVTMIGQPAPMIPQSASTARVQQFLQPMKVWQPMQPVRTSQFRQRPVAAADSDEQTASNDFAPSDSESRVMSRRAALASGLIAAAMMPQASWAVNRKRGVDDPEAELARLEEEKKEAAAKKAAKEAAKTAKKEAGIEETDERSFPIAAAAGGGVLLSVPLYFANLQRLGTKVASGGKDDGYGKNQKKRR